MIFGRDFVTCDDFGDCNDEVAVAGVDFIDSQLICSHYLRGEGYFWALPPKTNTPDHQSHYRWSWRGNQELKVMCVLCCARWCNCWYSFIDLDVFLTGSRTLDLAACPMFWGWLLDSAYGLHSGFSVRQDSVHREHWLHREKPRGKKTMGEYE
jgi:hypothetical protein